MLGKWKTAAYVVRLTDDTSRTVYAASQTEAEERVARLLARHRLVGLAAPDLRVRLTTNKEGLR